MNSKQEYKKIINSFKYAIEGFVSSFKTERNMKIHIMAQKWLYSERMILQVP